MTKINLSSFYYIKEASYDEAYLGKNREKAIRKAKERKVKRIRKMYSLFNDDLDITFSKGYFSCQHKKTNVTNVTVNGTKFSYKIGGNK